MTARVKGVKAAALSLWILLAFTPGMPCAAAPSASDLLDEAIWWPGDFAQVCRSDDTSGPFAAPHIDAYGPLVPQSYFLSKDTVARLQARHAELSAELVARLKVFDWLHPPAAPRVSKKMAALKNASLSRADPNAPGPGPWEPANSRALGGAMLRVIGAINAVEALPELLRLEDELNTLNKRALDAAQQAQPAFGSNKGKPPDVPLPVIDLGGTASPWDEWSDDWEATGRDTTSPWSTWRVRLSDSLVFQRELLGVCLGMVDKAGYAPLKTSLVGRLRNLGLQRRGRVTMEAQHIGKKEDITEKLKDLHWDDALGVPLYPHMQTDIPGTAGVRQNARAILEAFLNGGTPPSITDGAALLGKVLDQPGGTLHMDGPLPTIPFDVPLSPEDVIASRYAFFNEDTKITMMAHRELLIPPLTTALAAVKVKAGGSTLPPLLLHAAGVLNAVETLPQVLQIEADLHDLIIQAGRDPSFIPPLLGLNSRVIPAPEEPADGASPAARRKAALFACRIWQREALGLVFQMLLAEHFEPLKQSKVLAAFNAEGHQQLETKLPAFKSEQEFTLWKHRTFGNKRGIGWLVEKNKAYYTKSEAFLLPVNYTEAGRAELRQLALRFIKTVPLERREAGNGMKMSWLYDSQESWLADYGKD